MKKIALLLASMLISITSHAQLGGFLKDLKSVADKAKQQSQNPQPPTQQQNQQQQTQSQSQGQSPQPTQTSQLQNDDKSRIDKEGFLHLSKSDFKSDWCKNIESNLSSPYDYRGVKPGDLCNQPDEIIDKIFLEGYALVDTSSPRIATVSDHFRSDKFNISKMTIVYHYSAKKIYIANFQGAICATDKSNSLNPGNSFRNSLQSKYGEPSNQISSYEVLKSQHDALKTQIDASRKNAVTVQEAKKARDGQVQLEMLSNLLKNPNLKSEIAQLEWSYSGNYKRSDTVPAIMIWQANVMERTLCNRIEDQFSFTFNPTGALVKKLAEIGEEGDKIAKESKKNAPTPKF